jgi:hypothetical protein
MLHKEIGGVSYTLDDRDILRSARTDLAGLVAGGPYPMMIDD